MSEKVETRVVKMEFDNAKFERDVKQSISTLDKFDKRLRFEGVSDSVEKVTKKITAFEVAAVTAIANISNRITNLGIRMIKSLSIDNISSGWDKFGEKTVAVATMAAQKIKIAGKAIDDYSKKMEVINQQLEKLNWFTDETSYNFTDMVDSIGKFTAAGQDLDKSVSAMMGIANWAALSGQNASKASSAMYQLAQAMGKGYVQLIDWKSIQNLSMDTIEFREAVLETAVSMGQLTKEADKFITKTGKKFTISQFAEELNSKWFTTDVLVNTLGKYSAAIERIYEISQETGLTASQIMKRYASELDEFGLKAFKAAQEARTLADALNSVRDAVSTGWMNTAEKIFGGYDESKELFTDLANELYEVFAEGGNFRNEILGLWSDLGGRADLFKHGDTDQGAFWNIYDSVIAVRDIVKSSWNTIFPKSAFESYNDQVTEIANNFKIFTDRLKNYTATIKTALKDNQKLSNIFTGLFSLIKIGAQALNGIRYSLDPILTLAKNTLGYITDRLSYLVSHTSKMEGVINTINSISIKLHDTIESIIDVIDPRAVLGGILNFLKDIVRTIKDNAPLESFATTFKEFFESLKENGANAENFKRIMNGLISIINMVSKLVIEIVKLTSKYLLPVLNVIVNLLSKIVSFSTGLIVQLVAFIGDLFTMLDDMLSSSSTDSAGNKFNEFLTEVGNNARKLVPVLKSFGSILSSLVDVIMIIPNILNKISIDLSGRSIIDNILYLINNISTSLKNFSNDVKNGGSSSEFLEPLVVFVKGITDVFKSLLNISGFLLKIIGKALSLLGSIINAIAGFFNYEFEKLDKMPVKDVFKSVAKIGIIVLLFWTLNNGLYGLHSAISPLTYTMTTVADAIDRWSISQLINSLGYLLRSIGQLFLEIGIGLALINSTLDTSSLDLNKVSDNIFKILNAVTILLGIIMAFKTLINLLDTINDTIGFFKEAKNVLFDRAESLKDDKQRNKNFALAAMLSSMALLIQQVGRTMILIAISFKMLSKIKKDDMWKGIVAFGMLSGLIITLSLITKKDKGVEIDKKDSKSKANTIKAIGILLASVGFAFKAISKALVSISNIPVLDLLKAVGALTIIFGLVGTLIILVERFSQRTEKKLKKVTEKSDLTKESSSGKGSLDGLASIFASMSLFMISISASLGIMSLLDPGRMWSAIGAISVIFAQIGAMLIVVESLAKTRTKSGNISRLTEKQGEGIKSTFGAISALLLSITASVALLSLLNPGKMWSAIGAISLMLGQITLMIILLNKMSSKGKVGPGLEATIKQLSKVMLSVAGMILAVAVLAKLPIKEMWSAIGAITVLFGNIAAMMMILTYAKVTPGDLVALAIAIVEMAGGLILFSYAIEKFNSIPWSSIGKGLLLMAGGLTIMGVAGKLLEPIIPAILKLSLAITALGLGLYLTSSLLPSFIENIIIFAQAIEDNKDTLIGAMTSIVEILVVGLLEGIRILFAEVNKVLPTILETFKILISGLSDLILNEGPILIESLINLLDSALKSLADHAMSIAENVMSIIIQVLQVISKDNNVKTVVNLLVDIFLKFLAAIGPRLGELIAAIVDVLITLIKELFKNLGRLLDVALPLVFNFIIDLLGKLVKYIVPLAGAVTKLALIIIATMLRLILQASGFLASELIAFFSGLILLIIEVVHGMTNVIKAALLLIFRYCIEALGDVLVRLGPAFAAAGKVILLSMGQGFLDAIKILFKGTFLEKGVNALLDPISKKLGPALDEAKKDLAAVGSPEEVLSAMKDAGNNIMNVIDNVTDFMGDITQQGLDQINNTVNDSLSGISETVSTFSNQIGGYMSEGLEQGALDNQQAAEEAGAAISNAAIEGARDAAGVHSPSTEFIEIGKYMCEGLVVGIEENQNVVINKATDLINKTIIAAHEAINNAINGNVLTITPVMDLSSIRAGASDISQIMSNVSGGGIRVSGNLASAASSELRSDKASSSSTVINNGGDTYNATFNVTTNNPQSFSEDVDKELQHQRLMSKLAKGGAY